MLNIRSKSRGFDRLPQLDECEALTLEGKVVEEIRPRAAWQWNRWLPIAIVIAFAFVFGAFVEGICQFSGRWLSVERFSRYEPVMGNIAFNYRNVNFNGSLFHPNTFRKEAGAAVDAAWESLGVDYRSAIVPTNQAGQAGLSSSHVQVSDKYGGGFPANIEGLHHLHCLNLLRQALYFNVDYYRKLGKGAFVNADDILKAHVSHCLDILRQQLMCTVDVGVLGQIWWNRKEPRAYPDFNTQHKCRDFEAVRQWAEVHQAPDDVPDDFLKPPKAGEVVEEIP